MTRKEAVFQFFRKSIVPVAGAALLVCIFKSACIKDGTVNYLRLWILCGLPFGLHRQRFHGWRGCLIRAELHYWRCHRWVCPSLATDCSGVVCAADCVSFHFTLAFINISNNNGRIFCLLMQEVLPITIL